MRSLTLAFVLIAVLVTGGEAKGGRGGGSRSRSSSSSSRSSSSGGWFGSKSSSSSSHRASTPAHNPPSYGSHVSGSPSGAPPAYPGLANRPVSNHNSPPGYSPSYSNPPGYHPNYYQSNSYNSYYPGNNYRQNYGSTFGSNGLGGNTYIHNNYYGTRSNSGGSSFLTHALFYNAGSHSGYRRSWNHQDERRWRGTTKAPYFENKVPDSEKYLPAAAVVGAATAFGLVSLLPLNVPAKKPLMYCNTTDIEQVPIMLESKTYSCVNETLVVFCPSVLESSTVVEECFNQTMSCDVEQTSEKLYCKNETLFSQSPIVCNSTTSQFETNLNKTKTVLNCYFGSISEASAASIPIAVTEVPYITTTEKDLSLESKIHVFFMHLVGKGEIVQKAQIPTTTTAEPIIEDPRLALKENETLWTPEAMTIPPETSTTTTETLTTTTTEALTTIAIEALTTTTTEALATTTETTSEVLHMLAFKTPRKLENGTLVDVYEPVSLPEFIFKIPLTTEKSSKENEIE